MNGISLSGRIVSVMLMFSATVSADIVRRPVPPQVVQQARNAVQEMGRQVRMGNYAYLMEKMYGPWKSKEARRMGGEQALMRKVIVEIPQAMRDQGLQITEFRAGQPTGAFEVKPIMRGGQVIGFREWLVFVPTAQRCRVAQAGKVRFVESTGFQVAIVSQGQNNWEFINGANLSVDNLRRLFPNLPIRKEELGLPEVGPFVEVDSGTR